MTDFASDRPSTFPWPPVLLAAILAVSAVCEVYVFAEPLIAERTWTDVVGLVLCFAALVLLWRSTKELTTSKTTVRPDRGATVLVTSGPFRWSRNPLYLADVVLLIGLGLLGGWGTLLLGGLVFGALVTWLAILPEEAHLERRFGEEFRAYKAKVRRWI